MYICDDGITLVVSKIITNTTIMHAMGVPEAYVMERGGWKTNVVLNQVYRGTRSDFSKKYAKETNDYFGKNIL